MKKCNLCKIEKSFDEFGKRSVEKDGKDPYCRPCRISMVRAYRATEKGRANSRATVRRYHASAKGKKAVRRYEESEKGRKKRRKDALLHRTRYADKIKARQTAFSAIKSGRLSRQPCMICGENNNIQAHHEDYSKPLDVLWLCIPHHNGRHKNIDMDILDWRLSHY